MRTHIKAGLIFSAILISCAAVFGADTIELPFEYFAGRWVNGHYLHGNYYLQKDHYPRYSWSYLLTSDPFRFSIDRFQTNLLYKYQNDEFLSAPMSLDYRPFDHWQIGINNLVYRYTNRNNESELTNPEYHAYSNKRLTFNVTSYWQRHTDMAVTDRAAPYAYRVQPILTKGNVTISNDWFSGLYRYRANSQGYIYKEAVVSRTEWNLRNSVQWGVADRSNIGVNAFVRGAYSDEFSYFSSWSEVFGSSYSFARAYRTSRRHDLEFQLSFSTCELAPLFVSGSAFQTYLYNKADYSYYRGDSTGLTDSSNRVVRRKLMRERNGLTLSLDYLDRGDFDNAILLDDYSNFYRRMLFDGQNHVSLDVSYDRDFRYNTGDLVSVDLSIARGLSNRAEVGASTNYNWQKRRRYNQDLAAAENLSVEFSLRYRSYDYVPGTGPGWHRDSPLDWLYGPTLAAGQTYLSMTLRPYAARSRHPTYRGFMTFDLDRRDPFDWLETDLQVGLGRGLSVTADDLLQWDISRGVILRNAYSLQLEGRIMQRFLLTAGFSQTFVNNSGVKDVFSDPKFEINLHGLL